MAGWVAAYTVDSSLVTSKYALVVAHLAEQKVDWAVGWMAGWFVCWFCRRLPSLLRNRWLISWLAGGLAGLVAALTVACLAEQKVGWFYNPWLIRLMAD
jgi:hypothetical protein